MSVYVMSWVWRHGPKDATDRLVLLAVADHADDDGVAYPSMIGIATKSCLTERGARGVIRRLESGGWLRTKVGGGRGGKSVYTVLMQENPEPVSGNDIPGMRNPEQETGNVAAQNPEPDCTKPGTSLPLNHQGTIKEPSTSNNAREVFDILSTVASPESARSFIAYRRKHKGGGLTVTAVRRLSKQLQRIFADGGDVDDALGMAEERGWMTVQPDWYFKAKGQTNEQRNHAGKSHHNHAGTGANRSGTVDAFAAVAAKMQRDQTRG